LCVFLLIACPCIHGYTSTMGIHFISHPVYCPYNSFHRCRGIKCSLQAIQDSLLSVISNCYSESGNGTGVSSNKNSLLGKREPLHILAVHVNMCSPHNSAIETSGRERNTIGNCGSALRQRAYLMQEQTAPSSLLIMFSSRER